MVTTIQVTEDLKKQLDRMKMYGRETYNEVIERILEDFQELSEETKKEIEIARKQIAQGKFKTHEEVKAELGL